MARSKLVLALVVALALPSAARAHAGPPFPLIVDEIVGPWVVSVWADPDIGIGTFIIVLEPADEAGEPADETGEPPAGTHVRVGARPVSGRLPEAVHEAKPEPVRYGERHVAEVPFDRGEFFDVRFIIDVPGGRGGELVSRVEATPDGSIGPIGMIVYLLPFLAVGFLWLKVALKKRELAREAATRTT